jgi:hypothetical protein
MKYSFFFLVFLVFFIISEISINKNNTTNINVIKSNHEKIRSFYNKNSCNKNNVFFFNNLTVLQLTSEDFNSFILFIGIQKDYAHFSFDELEVKKKNLCVYLKNNLNLDEQIIKLFDFFLTIKYFEYDNSRHTLYNPYYGYGTSHANINLVKNYENINKKGDIYILLKNNKIEVITLLYDGTYLITKF